MTKHISLLLLLTMLFSSSAMGEIIVLQSGKTMTGQVLMQNDQIIVISDAEGRKFQFPRAEVIEITRPQVQETTIETPTPNNETTGNCALRLDMSGGALFVPTMHNGGATSLDLQIGTRHIKEQNIFLGGSVGYQAAICDKLYNFLPLMLVVSVPLIQGKHAPEVGAALGYAFALKQPNQGGMCAKLDVSWRYQYQQNSALLLGIQARFQDAQVSYVETIENKTYTSVLGKNFVSLGLRLAFLF